MVKFGEASGNDSNCLSEASFAGIASKQALIFLREPTESETGEAKK